MAKEARPTNFKDWFDRSAAERLAAQVAAGHASFDRDRFVTAATRGLERLEMMERVRQFADALQTELPPDPASALSLLRRTFPPELRGEDEVTGGWLQWPVGEWIARYASPAAAPEAFDEAVETMTALTQRFSSEFAVRPFVRDVPERIVPRLLELTGHESVHVRRWCSEGVRPLLPWGERLRALRDDPRPILPILDALHRDPSEYVRRSVANCLGDVAKDHLTLAVETARGWLDGGDELTERLVSHALRAPIKAGAPEALALVGYGDSAAMEATLEVAPARLAIGESATLTARLTASQDTRVMVDLVIEYVKANGTRSPKVFKWAKRELAAGETVELAKSLAFVPRSTRRLYPGEHAARLQLNGRRTDAVPFELIPAASD